MECNFCKESTLNVGQRTSYRAVIVFKIGGLENGWFAALSPKTGGDTEKDFLIQIIPKKHLKYFSEIDDDKKRAENYGITFGKISHAIAEILKEQDSNTSILPIGTYGKCKHEDEHIHIKLFPYRGDIGQPFTLDSSFSMREVDKDGEEFIKLKPVHKRNLSEERLNYLSKRFIDLLNQPSSSSK